MGFYFNSSYNYIFYLIRRTDIPYMHIFGKTCVDNGAYMLHMIGEK